MKRIIILGGGAAGTMMASKLARQLNLREWEIVVVDKDNQHIYQPGLLFLPFGTYNVSDVVKERRYLLPSTVDLRIEEPERIDAENSQVHFKDGDKLGYDLLIIATGCRIAPEDTEGLTGPGWLSKAFDFYTLEGATELGKALERFEGGRLVLNIADMPIKCPVAPLEFAFLADAYFTEKGIRDKVELVYATPLDGAFTKPIASSMLGDMFDRRRIQLEPNFMVSTVDNEDGVMEGYDGRKIDFDLLVTIPLHHGSKLISKSELGDDFGFIPTDKHTLQSKHFDNIFALGDATDLPASKAGAVAHFQAEVLIENVQHYIAGRNLDPGFDGHANCFIETGFGKAMLIDFNYTTEPLPGKYPLPGIGPFSLLKETHLNHWGKLGFKWAYWNLLLRGEELPIDHRMLMAGKRW